MIVHDPHVMLIRSIFTTLAGSDRICATIGRFTNFTNNSLSKSFRCSKTEKDARIMEFGCFRALSTEEKLSDIADQTKSPQWSRVPANLVGVTVTSVWIGLPVAYLLLS